MPSPPTSLPQLLQREQRAFLRRRRTAWRTHLQQARVFLGEGLRQADPSRPCLILGAGSGLEVPWAEAPPLTWGWDGDPWSRLRTALRHRRWPPWIFEDVTSAFGPLVALLQRVRRRDWRGRPLGREAVALARLAGLLDTLPTQPTRLRHHLAQLQPSTILAANLMGQLGVLAETLVEQHLGPQVWQDDPDLPDPVAEALDGWTARVLTGLLEALRDSSATLWLLHDRAVFTSEPILGPWHNDWRQHVRSDRWLDARDPLAGLDIRTSLCRSPRAQARWLWPVGPGQVHLVEALSFAPDERP